MPRRVVSFIGGIDLCDGRYDTHDHPLFRTLQLEHKHDFYQDCLPGVDGEAGGAFLFLLFLLCVLQVWGSSRTWARRRGLALGMWADRSADKALGRPSCSRDCRDLSLNN